MAGEKSKSSGEIGESIAAGLLDRIGWKKSLKNVPIKCNTPTHRNEKGNQRTSHGEDQIFLYNNPFHDVRTDVVHVSVKNKIGSYPASESALKREFKEHLAELHEVIECARYSEEVSQATKSFKARKKVSHSGLLIWVHNDAEDIERDIKPILSKIRLEQESDVPVYLIDSGRAGFVMKVMDDIERRQKDWAFFFPVIGTVTTVDEARTGAFLPLEIIASDVLPIVMYEGEKTEMIIYANQAFSTDAYTKLIAYGLRFCTGLVATIRIGMPDYNPATDKAAADLARLAFSDRNETIEPFSFNRSILALLNEA
ncbi:MAG: hypothetical protein ROZ37_15835 [Aromatoleum sp.]|jgi:hypothetical protein|uniref:GapS4a family protein n=1 Tax=Aromatoleum sp. TaxID=2307007 RepID=UPI002893C1F7|nr:hypothetical protein [Aromatoleum sp.]MDT3671787.1 hypothetical protein [Aromatoleum sp.]